MPVYNSNIVSLIFTTLWEYLADDKLMIFFLIFPEIWIWHFMQIISTGDNLHKISNLVSLVDLLSPMICANIQPQGIPGSREEDF